MEFDLVIFNGSIVTASDVLPASLYVGINGEKIQTISTEPLKGKKTIDAKGGLITPGGIDSHVHLDQENAPTGDDFYSGSRSAIAGGTTTIIPFAIQQKNDDDLRKVVNEYHKKALKNGGVFCDYGFHLVISRPTAALLEEHLPHVINEHGITSVKVYTTYPRYKLTDMELLNILLTNRKLQVTTMIHAENSDIIDFINEKLLQKQWTDPFFHSESRPIIAEDEASYRVISLAKMIDVPILIVHMSAKAALDHVRKAQDNLTPILAETCPQYLFLTSDRLKQGCCHHLDCSDPFEGAKYICSPPLRSDQKELEGVWQAISNGTVTVFSSDHAPSRYDHPEGKKKGLINGLPHYKQIPNGLPGVETRLPLLFCYGVEKGRITPQRFVELTSTNPAKLYGLSDRKGTIAVGMDADITVWYPRGGLDSFALKNEHLHHSIDYTPYEGMKFTNWPRYTILRGKIVYDKDNGGVTDQMSGSYIKRKQNSLCSSVGNLNPIYV